ncbi:MAG: ABC transporter substrate-binding protein, partial [Chloroflexota bacterium]|nr:ABC transporter substrate-binding protein [Chloroflexota bacterium]
TPAPTPSSAKPAPTVAPVAPAPPAAKPGEEKPRYGGILSFAMTGSPRSLDLHQETSSNTMHRAGPHYDTLIQYDPLDQTKIIPDLAERWEVSPDGTVFTFYLNKGVKFHDGKPLTSEDVRYSLERVRKPPKGVYSPREPELASASKIEAPDPDTVRITLSYPTAAFLSLLANPWHVVMPKHVLEAGGQDALKMKPVGSGPFKYVEFMRGVSYTGTRNESYFRKGRPYVDGYVVYDIPDRAAIYAALRTKRILMVRLTPMVIPSQAEILRRELPGKVVLEEAPTLSLVPIFLNMKRPPFDNVKARQAVALAIDRKEFSVVVYEGQQVASGPMAYFGKWGLSKEELDKYPGFGADPKANLAQARKLLSEVTLPKDAKVDILVRSDQAEYAKSAQVLSSALAALGIKSTLRLIDDAGYYDLMIKGDFHMSPFSMAFPIDDPDSVLGQLYVTGAPRNYMGYSNLKVDDLFQKQSREMDPAKRKGMTDEIQRMVLQDVPMVVMGYRTAIEARWAEVRNWKAPIQWAYGSKLDHVWLAAE